MDVMPPPPEAKQIDFPGKDPGEDFQFYFHRHWIHPLKNIGILIVWTIIVAGVFYASGVANILDDTSRRAILILLYSFFLIAHFIFLIKLYQHFLYIVVVTDKKIHLFKRTLVAVDRHETVDLWVLQDINKSQRGLFQNLLGFGSLRFEAQNSHMTIHFVPHIDKIYGKIVVLRESARHRMLPSVIANQEESLPVQPS